MSLAEKKHPVTEIRRGKNAQHEGKPLSPRAQRMLDDLDAVLSRPDPIGPEGWEAVRRHAREYGVRIGQSE